jgi:hypothetical protein
VTELRLPHRRASAITRTSWLVEGPFPAAGQLLTPAYPLPEPFTSVEVSWQAVLPSGALFTVLLRLANVDGTWSDWIPLGADPHTPPRAEDGWTYAPPVLATG